MTTQTPKKLRAGKARGSLLAKTFIYVILSLTVITIIYPIWWIVVGALNPSNGLYAASIIPKGLTLEHFIYLFTQTDYAIWFKNTLYIAVWNTIISTVLVITAAYAMSRFRFKGRKYGLLTLMILQGFPSFMGMIAMFTLLQQLTWFGPHGLLNSLWGLIIIYAGGSIPFNVWMIKGYFDSLPKSLEEAAKIDGASNTKIFFKVMLPLAKPMIAFVAVTHFIGPWMDYIFPSIVLTTSNKFTLAMGLYSMVTGEQNTQFSTFAAGAVLVALPISILFLLFQKQMTEGLTAGANKG
ncbi:sugar ABC transporter permease [Pullulanibacillus sp. KACC 23026]|uniref:sugar ABC transporter permease n=1 Tax=Pullulanibacillus sp. KACC 23026 TaxID=3028315 RepID=UPI0023AE9602|nr:sugar ABC transporter permease [Pullulanibacillus sp. KACC 23026]WEG13182.1 sugar ABC transporter permease [Pullulanibacillus sp. KACC 23026]